MINFGNNIKYYRKIRGLTQEELAIKMDVTTEFIKSIESKNKAPSLKNFINLCNILNVPSDFLLQDECTISKVYTIDLLMQEFDKFCNNERQFYIEILEHIISHKDTDDAN